MLENKCIQFKNNADSQQGLYFYGDIVSDEMDKWTSTDTCPQDIQDILNQIDANKPLNIYINSGGGSVFAGLAIYNMLKRSPCNKTVYVDGLAGSIASVIAMAGDKIVMPSNSFLMIHKPSCDIAGNSNDIRKMADDLDRIQEGILNVYAEKLAKDCSMDTIKQMVNNETWIVGSEASKYFNVEVVQSNKAVASVSNLNNYKHVPDAFKEMKNDKNTDTGCMCNQCSLADKCSKGNMANNKQCDNIVKEELEKLKAKLELELL
jgi:ATP-dependent protease ClpP protease subunit